MAKAPHRRRGYDQDRLAPITKALPFTTVEISWAIASLLLVNYVNVFLGQMAQQGSRFAKITFFGGLGLSAATFLVFVLLALWRRRNPGHVQIGPPSVLEEFRDIRARHRFRYKMISTDEDLYRVNELTRDVFGDSHPDFDKIWAIFKRNNRKSIVLVEYKRDPPDPKLPPLMKETSGGRGHIRGFASAWPLTDEAGQRIMRGGLAEGEIEAEEVLPSERNTAANYIYIPAIADNEAVISEDGSKQGLVSASAISQSITLIGLLDLLSTEFITDQRRRKVIMIEHSKNGGALINKVAQQLPPQFVTRAQVMHASLPATVTTIAVNADDVRRERERRLRLMAGIQRSINQYSDGEGFWN
jgi:hypothetical protein